MSTLVLVVKYLSASHCILLTVSCLFHVILFISYSNRYGEPEVDTMQFVEYSVVQKTFRMNHACTGCSVMTLQLQWILSFTVTPHMRLIFTIMSYISFLTTYTQSTDSSFRAKFHINLSLHL